MAAITCVVVALGTGCPARAAPVRIPFNVAPKSYAEGLLDLAQQANVTLIGAAACVGDSRRLRGVMTLEQALARWLDGAPCNWRVIAPGGVEITPLALADTVRAPPPPPATVSELLVTATRRVRDPRQLAVAVSAIPRREAAATGATDTSEAAGQLAGVLATNLGPGRNKLLLRGLSDGAYTGRARSVVATYLDDIPVNYNAPDPDFRLVDVERVEVARGPQGALYGAGALSGVYRIVSRRPDLQSYGSESRATGTLTQGGNPGYALEGFINVPILEDLAGVRIAAYQEVQGGYLDDVLQNREDVDRTERRGIRLMVLYRPDDVWALSVTAAGQHLRSDDTHYTTPGMGLERAIRIPEPHVNDIELLTGTVRRSWGRAELTSTTGYVRHRYASLYDATAQQHLYTNFARTSAYSERTHTRMLVQDLMLASRGASRLEWLVGLYASETRTHSPSEFLAQNPNIPNVPVYAENRRDRIGEVAAYGEVSYAFAPGWTLALGARVFGISERTRSDVVSEKFAPRNLDRSGDFTGVSPKISLQKEFGSGDLVYAVISEGYRAGGVNSSGALPPPTVRESFSPDRLINYEVGLKLERLQRRLSINSAVFYDVWKDIQTDQFRDSGIPYTTNAGDADILGVEAELTYRTDFGLTAQANARFARIHTSHANPDFTDQLVNGLPGAPGVSTGALISYERQVRGDWVLRLVGQGAYVGRSRVTFDSTLAKMGGFVRSKLSAELVGPAYGIQLFMLNPINAYSDTFAFGNPFNPEQTRQITPQRPRTIGITVSAAL